MAGLRGFTLLELVITIAIAAILLVIGVPGMRAFLLASSRGEASTSLYSALVLARAEAITRNAQVTICPRDYSNTNAFPLCASSATWKSGWIVYRDSAPSSTAAKPVSASDVIAVGDKTDQAFAIASSPSSITSLQFDAAGRISSSTRLSFTLCKTGDATFEGRTILVELNGRIALTPYKSCTAT